MADNVTLSISLIVLLIGVAINIYGFFSTRRKDIKTDAQEIYDIKEKLVELNITTKQTLSTTSDIRNEVKQINSRMTKAESDIVTIKEQMKNAFKQIDELKTEVKRHE